VREHLERVLGEAAVRERHDIVSKWMWDHEVFPKQEDETAPSPVRTRRAWPQALRFAAATAATCAAVASWIWALDRLGVDLPLPAWVEDTRLPWEQVASRSSAFLEAQIGTTAQR
jgi:hypothetical protein